jgi:transcriptional regulator with XRE-family HTH domain
MNQLIIGNFVAKKRKEKNLTQEQLAEKLGISNKTVSKWETGKCMPDYSIIQLLCKELDITVSELIDGEDTAPDSIRAYDEKQILDLIRRTQLLENQRTSLYGVIMVAMGVALLALSFNISGSNIEDFISGVVLGISIGELLIGVFIIALGFSKQK